MMKNAIILHGKPGKDEYYSEQFPSASNSHWLPWLQKQLQMRDIFTQTPEMPLSYEPQYDVWQKEFERFDVTPETILVGHSCGAGFIVRWLSEHPDIEVSKVVLVAPSLGKDWEDKSFFNFEIDPQLAQRTKGMTIFGSDNDKYSIKEAIGELRTTIQGTTYREFEGYGHFTFDAMKTDRFPELLQEVL